MYLAFQNPMYLFLLSHACFKDMYIKVLYVCAFEAKHNHDCTKALVVFGTCLMSYDICLTNWMVCLRIRRYGD